MYGSTPEYDAEALVSKQSESKPVPSQTLYGAIDEEAGGDSQPPHSGARGGRRRRLPVGDGAPRRRRDRGHAGVAERRLLGRRRGGRPAVGLRPVLTFLFVRVTVHVFYSYYVGRENSTWFFWHRFSND